ncbi:hypothetical protein ABFZ85_00775 [Hyphococcus formosus]|uniref:hypothetical protein n=1 Tax=Hyphococcus formosus TaxID=3143534 RepID=UPI00398B703D
MTEMTMTSDHPKHNMGDCPHCSAANFFKIKNGVSVSALSPPSIAIIFPVTKPSIADNPRVNKCTYYASRHICGPPGETPVSQKIRLLT